jgi:hypothetical protein
MHRFVVLLGAITACAGAPQSDATSVVEQFYAATIAGGVSGAPTPEQLATLAPYLSDTVRSLLAAARRQHDADLAREPDEKPSFVEGDLFSSLFEGPTAVEVLGDSARGPARVVTARMTYAGADPPATWTDHVVVTTERGRSVIDDIEYGGQWGFASKGSLRSSLAAALGPPQPQ